MSGHDTQTSVDDDMSSPDIDLPSQALMVRPTGKEQSFMQRIKLGFYKITWRTPLHNMRLTGKLPLRLLAVPVDELPADIGRGKSLLMGKFHFHGMDLPFHSLNYAQLAAPPMMLDYLHRFDWLRDLAAATNRADGAKIAAAVIENWLNGNAERIKAPAWSAENCAWRFLNMAAHAPMILSSTDPVYRSRILNHFARTARHLDQSAPRSGHRFTRLCAWAGVVAASLLLPEGNARRLVGERGLESAIQETVFDDGGVISRSPVQLIELIKLLSLLRQCYLVTNQDIPPFLSDALGRSVPALLGLTHADGGLGAWQGSAHIGSDTISAIVAASGVRARPQRQALNWGYQRVAANASILLLDAGPPPLAKQSPAGCASTLAFEFSHGARRIIVNCGGSALVGASIPATLARGLRTTAAHSTLCLDDTNSTAILQAGQLGKGVGEVGLERRDIDKATRIDATHDGYVAAFGFVHSRLLILRSDGLELRGEDTLLPHDKVKPRDQVPCHIRFHLGPDIEISTDENQKAIVLRMADGSSWLFFATAGEISVDDSLWVDEHGRPHPSRQLVIASNTDKAGLSIGWQLKYLG
jgi:uncharacterized heparinase superfamily protein